MKKIYLILMFAIALTVKLNAQCSGCTTNVTGLDAAPHIVSAGQVFCVAPTGTVTGQITVTAGGTLCNQGTINSFNLWIAGGTLKNYGTLTTTNVLIASAGTYTNYGFSDIDSLLISNPNTTYYNDGTQTSNAFGIIDAAHVVNSGTITTVIMGDSIARFTNNGTIIVTGEGFSNSYSSIFINNGNLTITNDFSNSYLSDFTNQNYMKVGRDFFNSTNADFVTNCMMSVDRDWYNSANIYGPNSSSCGGVNIAGLSYNSGTIGSTLTLFDICDAGNPIGGIDGNVGTIDPTTTYCACTNNCVLVTGIKEAVKESSVLISNIFPNPASTKITLKLNSEQTESLHIEVIDMIGKTVLSKTLMTTVGENNIDLNVANLSQGTYILSITDSHQLQTKRLFNVGK